MIVQGLNPGVRYDPNATPLTAEEHQRKLIMNRLGKLGVEETRLQA